MTDLEFQIIFWVQSLGPMVEPFMRLLTDLGYGPLYLVVIAILCWCGSPALGTRLAVLLLLSAALNSVLKILIHAPRPYWLRPEVFLGSGDGAAGMPSGHAQAATVFWSALAISVRRWWFWALAIFMIVGTCVSRIYFAVHFPSQILVGAGIGIAVLLAAKLLEEPFLQCWQPMPLNRQIVWLVIFYILLIAVGVIVHIGVQTRWEMPNEWANVAAELHPDSPLHVLSLLSFVRGGALLLGITIGACVLWQRGQFSSDRPTPGVALLRIIPGLAIGLTIWLGLGALATGLPAILELVVQGIRGLLFGLWLALVWPLIYLRFGNRKMKNQPITS